MQKAPAPHVEWVVRPIEGQKITRRCPGCEVKRDFVSSGAFRVNAQKKTIDVWHIYKCERCDYTWNIEVIARTNRNKIDPDLYNLFLQNDEDEARRRTFDYGLLARNRAEPSGAPDFIVEGPELGELKARGRARIGLKFEFLLPIRLENVLVKKLGLRRRQLSHLIESGHLVGLAVRDLSRRVKRDVEIEVDVDYALGMLERQPQAQDAEEKAFDAWQADGSEDLQ